MMNKGRRRRVPDEVQKRHQSNEPAQAADKWGDSIAKLVDARAAVEGPVMAENFYNAARNNWRHSSEARSGFMEERQGRGGCVWNATGERAPGQLAHDFKNSDLRDVLPSQHVFMWARLDFEGTQVRRRDIIDMGV